MPDLIARGSKGPQAASTAVFVGLRVLDPFLQYNILRGFGGALITSLGSHVFSQGPTSNVGIGFIDNLELSPYRLILLGFSVAAALKHAFWKIYIGEEILPIAASVSVGALNTLANSINTLSFIAAATSPAFGRGEGPNWPGWPAAQLVVGSILFSVGIAVETTSEIQRKAFKSKKENKGKAYTGGLFSVVRHPNYAGYVLWRTGFATAAGGWGLGAASASLWFYDFGARAIPVLDDYCTQRYADAWRDYKVQVPYKLFPGIW